MALFIRAHTVIFSLMRFVWLVFVGLIAAMALIIPRLNRPAAPRTSFAPVAAVVTTPARAVSLLNGSLGRADSIVAFGLAQRGTPYVYTGTSPLTGFDCSGFIMYTFAHFGVPVPHSTALLIDVGRPVSRTEAQPGDIVVFTGTAVTSTTPGHAGIVISGRGKVPLQFVHASSARRESGVKVSQVEGTDYERRFMQVRRVLEPSAMVAARATPAKPLRVAQPVSALPSRPIAVAPKAEPVSAPPAKLKLRKSPVYPARKSVVATKKSVPKPRKVVMKKTSANSIAAKKKVVAKKFIIKKKAVSRPR